MIYRFTVPGPPVGYTVVTHRGKRTLAAKKYFEWCKRVRMLAWEAKLVTPMDCTPGHPVAVDAKPFFGGKVHPDVENVQKGIVDALFRLSKDERRFRVVAGKPCYQDKFVTSRWRLPAVAYDYGFPRTEVEVATDADAHAQGDK